MRSTPQIDTIRFVPVVATCSVQLLVNICPTEQVDYLQQVHVCVANAVTGEGTAEPAFPPKRRLDIQVHPFVGSSSSAAQTARDSVPMTPALSQCNHARSPASDVDTVGVFSTTPLADLGLGATSRATRQVSQETRTESSDNAIMLHSAKSVTANFKKASV